MGNIDPKIEESWKEILREEFTAEYFQQLKSFLVEEKRNHTVYPPGPKIFAAFNFTPFHDVKAVIIGQDPYHGPGQAHGLCFSVPEGINPPPSLKNIFKEIKSDLGIEPAWTGNLEKWAAQGVLLLNATLTVRARQAGSHQNRGWEQFTDTVIKKLSEERSGIVFLLWGAYAGRKAELIDANRHHILTAPHPSPFSADRGFFGCKHFSKTNAFLRQQGVEEIDWS
jgi:uracil-DNA glycosylase